MVSGQGANDADDQSLSLVALSERGGGKRSGGIVVVKLTKTKRDGLKEISAAMKTEN